jgi:hypothetical protein
VLPSQFAENLYSFRLVGLVVDRAAPDQVALAAIEQKLADGHLAFYRRRSRGASALIFAQLDTDSTVVRPRLPIDTGTFGDAVTRLNQTGVFSPLLSAPGAFQARADWQLAAGYAAQGNDSQVQFFAPTRPPDAAGRLSAHGRNTEERRRPTAAGAQPRRRHGRRRGCRPRAAPSSTTTRVGDGRPSAGTRRTGSVRSPSAPLARRCRAGILGWHREFRDNGCRRGVNPSDAALGGRFAPACISSTVDPPNATGRDLLRTGGISSAGDTPAGLLADVVLMIGRWQALGAVPDISVTLEGDDAGGWQGERERPGRRPTGSPLGRVGPEAKAG